MAVAAAAAGSVAAAAPEGSGLERMGFPGGGRGASNTSNGPGTTPAPPPAERLLPDGWLAGLEGMPALVEPMLLP